MAFLTDDRAQALQVGAVLLFGILVILFTVWQAFVIPDANERVEFTHNQEVQSEMVSLQGTAISAADSGTPQSTSVQLGQQFPSRLLFVNPSPATGTLRTTAIGDGAVQITNANATGLTDEAFWNGTERNYTTRAVEYTPDYRVFQGAPRTVYDNTLLYNAFDRADETNVSAIASQSIIRDDTISLVMLAGSYEETGIASVNPSFTPVSTQTETVRVNSSEDDPLTLTIASEVDAETWEEVLADEDNVADVTEVDETTVEIELVEGTYELQLSKIGLGTGVDTPRPAYLSVVDTPELTRSESGTITVGVLDRYNSLASENVTVEAEVTDGDANVDDSATSGFDGQAEFDIDVGSTAAESITVEFSFADDEEETLDDDAVESVSVDLPITEPTVGAGEIEIYWAEASGDFDCEEEDGALVSCNIDQNEEGDLTLEALADGDNAQLHVQFATPDDRIISFNQTDASIDDPDVGIGQPNQATVEVDSGPQGSENTTIYAFGGGSVAELEINPEDD